MGQRAPFWPLFIHIAPIFAQKTGWGGKVGHQLPSPDLRKLSLSHLRNPAVSKGGTGKNPVITGKNRVFRGFVPPVPPSQQHIPLLLRTRVCARVRARGSICQERSSENLQVGLSGFGKPLHLSPVETQRERPVTCSNTTRRHGIVQSSCRNLTLRWAHVGNESQLRGTKGRIRAPS